MTKKIFLFIITILIFSLCLNAADVNFKGFSQMWLSYADSHSNDSSVYGFTFKRVHFFPYGNFGKKIKWLIHVGYEGQPSIKLLDAFIDFDLSKEFKIKIGQFAAPGAISGVLTSSAKLDFLQRTSITQAWSGNSGLFSWRAMGVQAHGVLLEGKLYYALMVGNPKTLGGNFTPNIKSPTHSNEHNGINFWGRMEAKPVQGLRIGAFYGGGTERSSVNENKTERSSYGAFLIYKKKDGIRFKTEYIAGERTEYITDETGIAKYSGMFVTLGYRINKVEPMVRYDFYTPNDGKVDSAGVEKYKNLTFGINYYLDKSFKIQGNYVFSSEDGTDLKNNIFYVNLQYFFNSK